MVGSSQLLKLLFFILSFLVFTRFAIDPDFGWHLAMGREFHQSGQIIVGDQFSWTMPNFQWGNYFFAYQILTAAIFNKFGHIVLAVIFGLIAGMAVLILLPQKFTFGRLLIALLGVATAINLTVRPSTISFFLFAILLILLRANFYKKKIHALFWFLFFGIWANFHQGFVVGLLVFSFFLTFDFLAKRSKRDETNALERVLAALGAFLGTLLTPYHFRLWQGVIADVLGSQTRGNIAEWAPIASHFPVSIFFLLTGSLFLFILFKKFQKLEPPWFLTAAVVFAWAFLFTHVLPFWTAIFIFLATRNIDFDLKGSFFEKLPAYFALGAVTLVIFLNFAVDLLRSQNLSERLILDKYPVAAASFIKDNQLTERVFNEYDWGGFIDWQHPEIKVFIDGRMTGWRRGDIYILRDYLAIKRGKCEVEGKYQIKTVLVKKINETPCFGSFAKVYEDNVAKVLVKR